MDEYSALPDGPPGLDVWVKQREAGAQEPWSARLHVMEVLHPLHLGQEPLEVLVPEQEAGGRVSGEVELSL